MMTMESISIIHWRINVRLKLTLMHKKIDVSKIMHFNFPVFKLVRVV